MYCFLSSKEETITWDEDGTSGRITTAGYSGPCWNRETGITYCFLQHCRRLMNNPEKLLEFKKTGEVPQLSGRVSLDYLYQIRPKLSRDEPNKIFDIIRNITPKIMIETILNDKNDSNDLTDYQFLARLSANRNWKSGCAICLTDKIMGTTCGCGHTEIVIFRPCGHSICSSPCFENLLAQKEIELADKQFTSGGQQFVVPGSKNVKLNFDEQGIDYECLICREKVMNTFQAEEVYGDYFSKNFYEQFLKNYNSSENVCVNL